MTPLGSQPTSKLFLALAFMFGFVFGSTITCLIMATFTKLLDSTGVRRNQSGEFVQEAYRANEDHQDGRGLQGDDPERDQGEAYDQGEGGVSGKALEGSGTRMASDGATRTS